uniref:Uncharacterized protein n=1 Tax=Ascaris lumbricoides TaxID=6252 RepID=A0A0M3HGJ3_ASCLU
MVDQRFLKWLVHIDSRKLSVCASSLLHNDAVSKVGHENESHLVLDRPNQARLKDRRKPRANFFSASLEAIMPPPTVHIHTTLNTC